MRNIYNSNICRFLSVLLSTFLIFSNSSCSSNKSKSPDLELHLRLQNQKIALITNESELHDKLELYANNRSAGIVKGFGAGTLEGLGSLGSMGGCSGDFCGVALLLMIPVAMVVGGTIGAVKGYQESTPGNVTKQIEETVNDSISQLEPLLNLAERIPKEAKLHGINIDHVEGQDAEYPNLLKFRDEGYVELLEVTITEIKFVGQGGKDPKLSLNIDLSARIIDLASQKELYSQSFHHETPPEPFSLWSSKTADEVKIIFDNSLNKLTKDTVQYIFSQTDIPITALKGRSSLFKEFGCCWMCPQYPPKEFSITRWGMQLNFPIVDSLRPNLTWDKFPSDKQQKQFNENTGHEATNVRYDLRIWEAEKLIHEKYNHLYKPGSMVYERINLPTPNHTVEVPLGAGQNYFWSFRACFNIGTGQTCTPWASFNPNNLASDEICGRLVMYYRFQTQDNLIEN